MNAINSNTGVLYIVVVPIVVILLLAVSVLFATHNPDSEKVSVYDCGIIAIGDTRGQFPIAYYVVAILFLVFDVEIILQCNSIIRTIEGNVLILELRYYNRRPKLYDC